MDVKKQDHNVGALDRWDFGSILAFGISFGFIAGLMLENIGMGLSCGLALAVFLNALREKREQAKGSSVALVIATAALVAIPVIWIWAR